MCLHSTCIIQICLRLCSLSVFGFQAVHLKEEMGGGTRQEVKRQRQRTTHQSNPLLQQDLQFWVDLRTNLSKRCSDLSAMLKKVS